MKYSFALLVPVVFLACSTTRQTNLSNHSTYQAKAQYTDSLPYAKLTFVADQKDYLPQMLGTWLIHTMQRQASLPEESLNMTLLLTDNRTFIANTACGDLAGSYSVKGMSIKFKDVGYNRNQCGSVEQLDELVRLLTQSVSLYTVNGNMLFLKDNSGNNVFRITR